MHTNMLTNNISQWRQISSEQDSCIQIPYMAYIIGLEVAPKTDTLFYLWDNFGNSAPILTILSQLQAEIYGA